MSEYDWGSLDDLDVALINFVETSILNVDEIQKCAGENEKKHDQMSKVGSFENSWRSFHDNFANNDDEVCAGLVTGFKNSFDVLSRRNLDEVVQVLRELDRQEAADALIDFTVTEGTSDFWLPDDPFDRSIRDTRISEIASKKKEATKPVLNFEVDLVLAAQSMNQSKLSQLASVAAEQYQSLFESRSGEQLRRLILSALDYRRISNASDDMTTIVQKAEIALRAIAKKSKLNELRVQKYGVAINNEDG
jgi:hypothetical protein